MQTYREKVRVMKFGVLVYLDKDLGIVTEEVFYKEIEAIMHKYNEVYNDFFWYEFSFDYWVLSYQLSLDVGIFNGKDFILAKDMNIEVINNNIYAIVSNHDNVVERNPYDITTKKTYKQ